VSGDPSMVWALALADGLDGGRALALPAALEDIEHRAEFIDKINDLLMTGSDSAAQLRSLGKRLRYLGDASVDAMPEVSDALDRVAIVLRLWAGCLSAAKTIAEATRSGPNAAEDRARLFPGIDATAARDALFRAGVEAAPSFKRRLGQSYFLDGVPDDSPVRKYE
jgi:hypothetical protein